MIKSKEFRTQRIRAIPVIAEHHDAIEQVLLENKPVLELLSPDVSIPQTLASHLNYTDVPPNGSSDNIRAYLLRSLETGDSTGLLSFYIGYPIDSCVYIGSLFLRPCWRQKGIGSELLECLHQNFSAHGYFETRALVGLKNWPALRFWSARGYRNISNFVGDTEYGEGQFCSAELRRNPVSFAAEAG